MSRSTRPRAGNGRALFPHPVLTVVLALVWLLLVNDVSVGLVVLGLILGVGIPLFTRGFWPDRPRIARPLLILRFLPIFLWDVVVANLQVAWLIVNVRRELRPTWVVVPLDITDHYALTTLANVISLTPGTVSSEFGPGRRTLLVHCLDVDDPDALVAHLKSRYEAPIKEIFEC
jgi:multicomponent K+:H+ antiporter subunit E